MAFWSIAALRTILATETDADSPGSEELQSQFRENWEALTMLAFDTSITTTCTGITETVWTDSGSPFANVTVGMTLLITSGTAIGNTYTIDATNGTTTVTLTGDTLVSDGVATTDTAKVMYDLKVNADGHDHDGVNSKAYVIPASTISQTELKTTIGVYSQSLTSGTNVNKTGVVDYAHWPDHYQNYGSAAAYKVSVLDNTGTYTSYNRTVNLENAAGVTMTVFARFRYHQSSGEIHWIYILRDPGTKEVHSVAWLPDHPSMGGNGDPVELPHPHANFDETTGEEILYYPDGAEATRRPAELIIVALDKDDAALHEIEAELDNYGDCHIQTFLALYDIVDTKQAPWPKDKKVSVKASLNSVTGQTTIIKKKIPKPPYAKCYKLKKRGS